MRQSWVAPLNDWPNTGPGTALASSTSLTDITAAPQCTIPANFLTVGSTLEVEAWGKFSNTSTPTLLLGVYWGAIAGTKLAATGATTTTTGATNWPWRIRYVGVVQSIGATGTILGAGTVLLGTSLTAYSSIPIDASAIAAVTIDTTAAKQVTVGAQWGTNSASNTITLSGFSVSSIV